MYHAGINKMLTNAVQVCREGGRHSTYDAFNILVAYLGKRLGLHSEATSLSEIGVDFNLLSSEVGDHLGGLYTSQRLNDSRRGQHFTPPQIAESMVKVTGVETLTAGQRILDPAAGTGIFLIIASKYIKPGVELYGIEIDRAVYRACLVQMKLYVNPTNPYYIICDDALQADHDWSKANQW